MERNRTWKLCEKRGGERGRTGSFSEAIKYDDKRKRTMRNYQETRDRDWSRTPESYYREGEKKGIYTKEIHQRPNRARVPAELAATSARSWKNHESTPSTRTRSRELNTLAHPPPPGCTITALRWPWRSMNDRRRGCVQFEEKFTVCEISYLKGRRTSRLLFSRSRNDEWENTGTSVGL